MLLKGRSFIQADIVYGLLLGGYGVTCIKILVRNLYKV